MHFLLPLGEVEPRRGRGVRALFIRVMSLCALRIGALPLAKARPLPLRGQGSVQTSGVQRIEALPLAKAQPLPLRGQGGSSYNHWIIYTHGTENLEELRQ